MNGTHQVWTYADDIILTGDDIRTIEKNADVLLNAFKDIGLAVNTGKTAHLNLLDFITLTIPGEWCKLWSSSLWNLLHSPFSSHLGPNIRLKTLFSNTLGLHSSLNVRDHASQPYSTSCNIIGLHILILKFLKRIRELINYFTYISTVVPSNSCVFLSCRPFVVNTTFSTGLVGFEVHSVE